MQRGSFDYVLIGAGPSGLTLATLLSSIGKKVMIVEKQPEIGGCHRVIRNDDGTFTEHGPRVYSDSYKNFRNILNIIGTSFDNLFTRYNFTITDINSRTISSLEAKHLSKLSLEFIKLILNPEHGSTESIYDFTKKNSFSDKAIDYIDRICRLTDGTDATRYSLNQFLNLLNQNVFYNLYQPRIANDKGLFKIWQTHLEKSGVTIITDTKVTYITNETCILNNQKSILFKKCVMCIPPYNIVELLKSVNIPKDIFLNNTGVDPELYVTSTNYNTYISCMFSWKEEIHLPKVHGFPISEWGIAFVVLSSYFKNEEYKTIISTNASILDAPSNITGKTANESTTDEVIEEIYNQIKEHLKLPIKPYKSQITPGTVKGPNGWENADTAFVNSSINPFKKGYPFASTNYLYSNLYNIGSHSLLGDYKFTTLESAVVNSIHLFNMIENQNFPVKKIYMLTDIIYVILTTLVVYLISKSLVA